MNIQYPGVYKTVYLYTGCYGISTYIYYTYTIYNLAVKIFKE